MNLNNSSYSGVVSLLTSANRQPELALQLLLKSVQTLRVAGESKTPSIVKPEVNVSVPTATSGKNVDTVA